MALLDVGASLRGTPPSQYLALACLAAALVVTAGYIFQEPLLYQLPLGSFRESGMALPTAIGLAVLCVGLLCARPDVGLTAVVTSPHLGGVVSRRFLLALLAAPAVGLAAMAGERAHLWEQEVAEALIAVAGMAVASILLLTTARLVNHLDATRQRALEEVLKWKEFFDRASWGAALTSIDGKILKANAAYAKIHGYELAELDAIPVASLVPDSQRAELSDFFRRAAALGHLHFECRSLGGDQE